MEQQAIVILFTGNSLPDETSGKLCSVLSKDTFAHPEDVKIYTFDEDNLAKLIAEKITKVHTPKCTESTTEAATILSKEFPLNNNVEAYCTEDYIANRDGVLHPHNAKYKVKEINEILKTLYELLYRYMPTCRVIKLPEFTHSSENHLRGPGPLSYTEATYEYLARCIEVYCGVNKINSVENLYGEQSLHNKLETRVINSGAVYKVPAMQKEIALLNAKIAELQAQIDTLKNSH